MIVHKILIVDDEIEIHTAFKQLFSRKKRLKLLFAFNAAEGLSILKTENISLVISDLLMPKMNGTEFLKKVKKICPDTIRMLLTGFSDINSIIEAINKGEVYRYLTKPWNNEELIIIIEQALEYLTLKQKNREMSLQIQKQNEELKESRDSFYSILKSIGEGVITTDFEGIVTFINPVAETFTGFTSKKAAGKALSEIFYVLNGKKRTQMENPVEKLLKEGLVIKHYKNYLLVNKNGVEIPVNFSISPILDEHNNMTGRGVVIVFQETAHHN